MNAPLLGAAARLGDSLIGLHNAGGENAGLPH